jgi:hypothetical protein
MSHSIFSGRSAATSSSAGPLLITVGLVGLIASAWLLVPVVTAMAVLTFGATLVTLARFDGTPALIPVIILHTAAYGGLYGLFIGARLHATASAPTPMSHLWPALDIALSTMPIALALQQVLNGLRQYAALRR